MNTQTKLEYAAYQVVVNCLRTQPGEQISIVTDRETLHIGKAIQEQFLKITKKLQMFVMDDFGPRPEDGSNPLPFPAEIGNYLKTCQVSVYAARGRKGELPSFRIPMLDIVDNLGTIRHGHMPNVNDMIMENGMSADYAAIKENNARIMKLVSGSRQAKVTTAAGTNLLVGLNPDWRWVNCDGNIQATNWSNLPDGEVFTCAADANGTIIVDGVLGDYMNTKYGVVAKNPVTIEFKNGRVQRVACVNKEIENDILEYTKLDENANRMGEFALGTNLGLEKLVGNLLQDEKFPGVHVALGHGYPTKTGSDWESKAHLDMVITKTTVEIDGKKIMEQGKFVV